MAIKVILFDLGNVVVDVNDQIAAQRISKFIPLDRKLYLMGLPHRSPKERFNLLFNSSLTILFEKGKISSFNFFHRVKEILKLKNLKYKEFVDIWNKIFFLTPKNLELHRLIRALRKNYKILLISNTNILHFKYLKKKFPIFDLFDNLVLSFRLKARKPQTKIYKKAIGLAKVKKDQVIYIDDKIEFVKRAKILGIESLHFKNIKKLKKDFLRLEIKWEKYY